MTELENRSNRLTIRFTDSERTTLRTTAEKLRLSEGEYGRKRILGKGEIKQIVIPQVNQDTCLQLTRLQVELNRQGVNLNQLLKLLHSRQADSETIDRVATLMEVYKETKATVDTYQSQLIKLHQYDREN
jgi:MobC-like protein